MSSQIRKAQNRIELKQDNEWLKNAFRKAMNAAMEQSANAAELTKALVVAVQKCGEVTVTQADLAALDENTKLRGTTDTETGTTTYSVYVEQRVIESDGETAIVQAGAGTDSE